MAVTAGGRLCPSTGRAGTPAAVSPAFQKGSVPPASAASAGFGAHWPAGGRDGSSSKVWCVRTGPVSGSRGVDGERAYDFPLLHGRKARQHQEAHSLQSETHEQRNAFQTDQTGRYASSEIARSQGPLRLFDGRRCPANRKGRLSCLPDPPDSPEIYDHRLGRVGGSSLSWTGGRRCRPGSGWGGYRGYDGHTGLTVLGSNPSFCHVLCPPLRLQQRTLVVPEK